MKATDKHSRESGPRVLLRAAIDPGVVLSDLWQLWCGEEHLSSPRQARDPGGLVEMETSCGPGHGVWSLSPNPRAFLLEFFPPLSFPKQMLEVKTELFTKVCALMSLLGKP